MVALEFSGDNFVNLDLPPKFDSCPEGSCDICCGLCFEVEKLLNTGFETQVEHMECTDKVDYNFVCDEDLEVYEKFVDWYYPPIYDEYHSNILTTRDEDFHVQFHQEVKVSHLYHDYVWEDFVAHDIMRKPWKKIVGEFDSELGLLFQAYSSLETIWKNHF
ncbi:hypothetical protein D8674_024946 [Pyrus ussuriensis x Pyrus communis]|uniref:Uncharacterized protein n=1 Tax=Pyrus ussuriensis x Pyrus communis TaxID=2448454 RepID=A0A5N5HHS1_9ROSA|nr:hypothetical protein D8674_024946 [Pyrus ussuriensis x Pyrus communis]